MSSFEPTGQAAPGWYPVDTYNQRYWDGYEWTHHLAPLYRGLAPRLTIGSTSEERTYAMIIHLAGIFFGILVPLVMWLAKKDRSPFIDYHGRQSLNLHLSMGIYLITSVMLILMLVGLLLVPLVVICFVAYSITSAVAANGGTTYKSPLAIRFFSTPDMG